MPSPQGVRKALPDHQISVADPIASQRERFESDGIATTPSNVEAMKDADVVILAVKPQTIEAVATELQPIINDQLVISIAAGTPLSKLNEVTWRTARDRALHAEHTCFGWRRDYWHAGEYQCHGSSTRACRVDS